MSQYSAFQSPVTFPLLRTNSFLRILFSDSLFKQNKDSLDTFEQISYVNKKRHTYFSHLEVSASRKKVQVTGHCDKLQFGILVHLPVRSEAAVGAAAFQSIDGSRRTGLPTVLVRRTARFSNWICFLLVLRELLSNNGTSIGLGAAFARELKPLFQRQSMTIVKRNLTTAL